MDKAQWDLIFCFIIFKLEVDHQLDFMAPW